jgi:transcriptional regulator with XRE-family HTH domain
MDGNGHDASRKAWEEYASRLRHYRLDLGLSQERLSERVAYSESAVGHAERLVRKPSEEFTREMERALGLDGELMELLPRIHNWMGPRWFQEWPGVEAAALTLRTSEHALIPGLLQSENYARHVFLGRPGATEEQAEKLVRVRLKRQAVFTQSRPPIYSALIDETVLYRPVGGCVVMREQLQHLLTVMNPPYITVRVVPLSLGLTTGLIGAFEVATMAGGAPAHAFIEAADEGRVTSRTQTVQALTLRWEALSNMAHPVNRSVEVIREAMEERYG